MFVHAVGGCRRKGRGLWQATVPCRVVDVTARRLAGPTPSSAWSALELIALPTSAQSTRSGRLLNGRGPWVMRQAGDINMYWVRGRRRGFAV